MTMGCCNSVNIVRKEYTITDFPHQFKVIVVHCSACGEVKANSSVTNMSKTLRT